MVFIQSPQRRRKLQSRSHGLLPLDNCNCSQVYYGTETIPVNNKNLKTEQASCTQKHTTKRTTLTKKETSDSTGIQHKSPSRKKSKHLSPSTPTIAKICSSKNLVHGEKKQDSSSHCVPDVAKADDDFDSMTVPMSNCSSKSSSCDIQDTQQHQQQHKQCHNAKEQLTDVSSQRRTSSQRKHSQSAKKQQSQTSGNDLAMLLVVVFFFLGCFDGGAIDAFARTFQGQTVSTPSFFTKTSRSFVPRAIAMKERSYGRRRPIGRPRFR